jgi:lipoate synthase
MIKQKIEKIKKLIEEIRHKNKKLIIITHYVNDNNYEYKRVKYSSLEELKEINNITENDDVLMIEIKYV